MAATSKDIFLNDSCIILSYPPGASGKFLINCLSFNSRIQPMVLPVFDNHQRQIRLLNLKLESFIKNNTKEEWNDLEMGDTEFYSVANFYHETMVDKNIDVLVETYRDRVRKTSHLNIVPCLEQNKFYFKEMHAVSETQFYRRVWPNSKHIIIENTTDYVKLRYRGMKKKIIDDIDQSLFDNFHLFNCMSFLKWTDFEKEYVKILDYLGLEPEYMDELKEFYTQYMNYWFEDLTNR